VTVVWEAGRAFDLATVPTVDFGAPSGPLDVETAFEIDDAMREAAERVADKGVTLARQVGLVAERLVVPEAASAAGTLARVAAERDARAVVVGAHGRGRISDLLLGSTARSLVNDAPCPVVVVR
jgi:nucleotide-binding universal stress UspA family protein